MQTRLPGPPLIGGFAQVMWKEEVASGEELIKEGDLHADFFYVVQAGASSRGADLRSSVSVGVHGALAKHSSSTLCCTPSSVAGG